MGKTVVSLVFDFNAAAFFGKTAFLFAALMEKMAVEATLPFNAANLKKNTTFADCIIYTKIDED